jgi:hypothetical protein
MTAEDAAPVSNGLAVSHELRGYALPTSALTTRLPEKDRGRTPLVLIGCGSFSPITYRESSDSANTEK